ncbi:hypothetical protein [Burkholderia ubonensis]|uniref:hypothetical protein n=1 Tax=Burkholderia ubonensis TaxID=101571 RepID=UPI000A841A0B|nr:hypothetical protein [Burkholderia ubonensis]
MNYLEMSAAAAGWWGATQQGIDVVENPPTNDLQSYVDYAQLVVAVASTSPWGAVATGLTGALLEAVAAANANNSEQAQNDVINAAADLAAFTAGCALMAAAPEAAGVAAAALLVGTGLAIVQAVLDQKNIGLALNSIVNAAYGCLTTETTAEIDSANAIFGSSPFFDGGQVCDSSYASAIASLFNGSMTDPLVIDLSGQGVQLTSLNQSSAYFDLHNTGFAVHTGWVNAGTGFLVTDLNSNGTIDNVTELFGNSSTDGFSALAALDINGDGVT